MDPMLLNASALALAELASLDRKVLAKRWQSVFGCPAPRHAQSPLLRSALAWRYQIIHEADTEVDRLVRRLRRQLAVPASVVALAPGTRLLREWQGQTYHVSFTAEGFEYGGRTYRSLTAISREITGTVWSGPSSLGCINEDCSALCDLHPQVLGGTTGAGFQLPGRPARGL
jgi:hypothetical protein